MSLDVKETIGNTFTDIFRLWQKLLSDTYRKYEYLEHSNKLDATEKKLLNKYIHDFRNLDKLEVWCGLRDLSTYLHRHHDKKVIFAVDEYDAAINSIFLENVANLTKEQ